MSIAAGATAVGQVVQGPAPPLDHGLLDHGTPASAPAAKLARVSIMAFNFAARLKLPNAPASADRVLEVLDLPQYYADTYGVHNVEMQGSYFASTESSYLTDFRARVEKAGSRMTQINLEFGAMNVSIPDPVQRNMAVDLTMRWVDHAVVLGCPRLMINQGQLTAETKANAIAALRRMSDYAKTKGVKISVETRVVGPTYSMGPDGRPVATPAAISAEGMPLASPGGPLAWEVVKETIEGSGTYSNVDVGNVMAPDLASLETVIRGLAVSNSGNMHMKTSPNWDLGAVVRFINNDIGYQGLYSIEMPAPQIRGVYETILANI